LYLSTFELHRRVHCPLMPLARLKIMATITAAELKNKTNEELAVLGERNEPLSAEGILIAREWRRRDMRLASKYSGAWAIIGAVIGAIITTILGAAFSVYLSKSPSLQSPFNKQYPLQSKSDSKLEDRHKRTVEPSATTRTNDSKSSKLLINERREYRE